MDDEEFWNNSNIRSFSFDEDDRAFSTRQNQKLFVDDNVSEISYELLTPTDIPLNLIISDENLRIVLEEQSLKETPMPKTISAEEELKILRRKAQEYYAAPAPSSIIKKILIKKPYSLECFRALHEKESLLIEAIHCADGDAILAVVLFLQKTLKKKHFNAIMQTYPDAVKHYINYLLIRCQVAEASEFLTMLGKANRSVILQFESVMKLCKSPDVKKHKLNKIYNESIAHQTGQICSYYSMIIMNYVALLEWQLKEKINNGKLINILDSSPLESLYHACANHKWSIQSSSDFSIANQSNPYQFCDTFKISQSQFDWIALIERAQSQAWCDLEKIFEKKSWHSLKTSKSFSISVPLECAILELNGLDAPVDILNIFLMHIDDPHRRLALAKRFNAGKSIVDSLVELKNRDELEKFIESLNVRDNVRIHAENALKNLQKPKWRTDGLKLLKN